MGKDFQHTFTNTSLVLFLIMVRIRICSRPASLDVVGTTIKPMKIRIAIQYFQCRCAFVLLQEFAVVSGFRFPTQSQFY